MAAEKYIFARLLLETTKIAKFYFKLKKQQGMQYSHSAGVAFCCGFYGVWRSQVVSTKQPALFLF